MDSKPSIRFDFSDQMIDYRDTLSAPEFATWRDAIQDAAYRRTDAKRHGDLPAWFAVLQQLPAASPSIISLDTDTIHIGRADDIDKTSQQMIHAGLFALKPWRKGPYNVFGTFIDTEWRSDWKWQRLAPFISDLGGRRVLDVGCGTGYHGWRMLGAGADYVLGIDPSMRFLIQFHCIQRYLQDARFDFLPIGIEDMPSDMPVFDSVFSMGVLYHRRNPVNHLLELKNLLRPGGELILETLIIDHIDGGILTPNDRYAMMRNVWSIMTVAKLEEQLSEAGFEDICCVDQNVTSLGEQRSTEWMQFHSLAEFLDPADHSKTIEGYAAPKRAILIAKKP